MTVIKRLFEQRSNLASAYEMSVGAATWGNWDVKKAVKEGYVASGWVYIAISKIAKTAASVPWVVFNADGEAQWEHPLSRVLAKPNPSFSRQDLMELVVSWLNLTGKAYLHKVIVRGRTSELWPVSPDRVEPVASKDPVKLIDRFKIDGKNSAHFTPETAIYLRFFDPSDPLGGIGPLQAAAKAVDIDVEQQHWNKAAMENRGVVDGIFTIKQSMSEAQSNSLWEKIKERYLGRRNARVPALFNGDVVYQRTALTQVETDFQASRRWNRDEILSILGVPAVLVGALEASTYNNYQSSLQIFWTSTIIPLLDDIKDTLNHSLAGELQDGYWIGYDLSDVSALRENEDSKAKTASTLWEMGVPVSVLNEKYDLGVAEFEGWDKPWGGQAPKVGDVTKIQNSNVRLREYRNVDAEIAKRDEISDGEVSSIYEKILDSEKKKLFAYFDAHGAVDASLVDGIKPLIEEGGDEWESAIDAVMRKYITEFAGMVVDVRDRRSQTLAEFIESAIKKYISDEKFVLLEKTNILKTTIDAILLHVESAIKNGSSMSAVQQAIIDSGIFEPSRALRIARTEVGAAQSIGQITAGTAAGATKKTWVTSSFGVRDLHQMRNGVTVPINGTWDNGIRFPLDPLAPAADRINCRCSMTFSV